MSGQRNRDGTKTTGLKRSPMPSRTNPPSRSQQTRRSAPSRAVKDTGPDNATRGLVWLRDGGFCVGCAEPAGPGRWWSIQHRLARGQGGGNRLSNLILHCGSATSRGCHRNAENRTLITRIRGYWIRANTKPQPDPAAIPVWYAREQAWFLLDDQGGRTQCDPPAVDPADREALLTLHLAESLEDGTFAPANRGDRP